MKHGVTAMSENNEFDPIQEDLAADAAEAAEDAASNLTESTAETVNEPASEAAAPNSGTEENTEYHYVRPEGRLYSDADYTRQEDTTAPPRYYTPPEKKPKKTWDRAKAKTTALGLCVALLGGVLGGVVTGAVMNRSGNDAPVSSVSSQASGSGTTTVAKKQTGSMTAAQIYDQATKQVVGIQSNITYMNFFGQTTQAALSGTGFFISDDGYILTNNHVISEASSSGSEINVLTYDGTTYAATVVGADASNDLAVLKIDASDCVPVTFGSSSDMSVGDTVYAVGNPMGELQFTMTSGMVSALDRDVTTEESGGSINMFQMDAAINSGNSGGPVYNANGEVIGVATAKYSSSGTDATVEGLGFAIPSDDAKKISNDLMTNGYVTGKAKMGVSIDQNYSSTVAQYYDMPEGAYVKYVETGSAAEKAGIQPGDIITKCGDKAIEGYEDLTNAIKSYSAGDTVEITVYRSGEESTLNITFDEANATQQQASAQQQQPQGNFFGFGGMPNAQSGAYISR